MKEPLTPSRERDRLEALADYDLLDAPNEEVFDAFACVAASAALGCSSQGSSAVADGGRTRPGDSGHVTTADGGKDGDARKKDGGAPASDTIQVGSLSVRVVPSTANVSILAPDGVRSPTA